MQLAPSAPEFVSLEELAARIPDGARVALPADYSGCAMAAVRALMECSHRMRLPQLDDDVPHRRLEHDDRVGRDQLGGGSLRGLNVKQH